MIPQAFKWAFESLSDTDGNAFDGIFEARKDGVPEKRNFLQEVLRKS